MSLSWVERKKREVWNGKIGGEMSKKQQLRLRFEGPTKFFSLIFFVSLFDAKASVGIGWRSDSTVTTF
jgi:hypothetical protein